MLLALFAWSCRPDPAGSRPRDPNIDVVHYAFKLHLNDANDEIKGEAAITVRFASEGVLSFSLDLAGKARRGDAFGMTVTSVSREGKPVAYRHEDDRLLIRMASPARAQEERTFTVAYHGVPQDGLIISKNKFGDRTFFGDNWPDRAHFWLPVVDHPSDKATVEFVVTAPDHYRVVSNGERVEEIALPDELRLTHWSAATPLPTKVMVIGAARFAIRQEEMQGGIPVESWVYPQDSIPGFHDFAVADDILGFFASWIGPYSFEKLANVQSTTRYGGMENAGAIFYQEDAIDGTGNNESLLAHEIAHQWFGDAVTEADWRHLWLSEGFATYFASLYLESVYGRGRLQAEMDQARDLALAFQRWNPAAPLVDTTVTDPNELLNANTYKKGAWVLHMLRYALGDEAFRQSVQAFYRAYRNGNALTEDFQRVAEEVSGQDLDWFFRQWVYESGYPRLSGAWRYDATGKRLTITLKQTQPGGRLFRMPVEVAIDTGAATRLEVMNIGEEHQTFSFPLAAPPRSVTLDPNDWLLMEATLTAGS